MWLIGITLLLGFLGQGSAENQYNVSYSDLDKCKQYNAVNGYNYHHFFKLEELDNHNPDNETIVNLRVFVIASKDAHILLSDIDSTSADAQVYEIVIGAGANTFSEIRKQRKKNPLKTKSTKNVLSPIEPLPLRVSITKDGLIEVGIEGQDLPLMSATDKSVISVRYLSFSSWGSTQAKWFYDCPSDDESVTQLEDFEPARDMTPKEKLLYNLQSNMFFEPPSWLTPIEIKQLVFTHVAYDSWKNTLATRFFFRVAWRDNRTTWVPEEHANITRIVGYQDLLWTPSIHVKDEKDLDLHELIGSDHVSFTYDGRFDWVSREIETQTFCALKESPDWPYERNECDLALSTDYPLGPLKLPAEAVSVHPNIIQSDWDLERITKHNNSNQHELFLLKDGSPRKESILKLHLKRNNEFYDTVLYVPYFTSNVMILVSFWMEGMLRIFANTFGTIMLIAAFLQMSAFVPPALDPKIFTFFHWSLYFSWICTMLFILDKWLQAYGSKMAPDSWLARLLGYPYLRVVLRLDDANYDSLQRKNLEWRGFVKVLDRIVFIVLMGILITSCFKNI